MAAIDKVPYLKHLKQFGIRENALIGQVAKTAADAIEEQAQQIGDLSDRLDNVGAAGQVSHAVSAILTVVGWTDGRQKVTIEGLKAAQDGVVGLAQDISTAEREAVANAEMYVCGQEDGAFTIAYGAEKPTCDIPIAVILFG